MLDRFDSGMADLTTSNAVAIALKRALGSDAKVRVLSDPVRREFYCLYERGKYPLPRKVSAWLGDCFRGISVEPIQFKISLPAPFAEAKGGSVQWKQQVVLNRHQLQPRDEQERQVS